MQNVSSVTSVVIRIVLVRLFEDYVLECQEVIIDCALN
jgi:hypothetical protein